MKETFTTDEIDNPISDERKRANMIAEILRQNHVARSGLKVLSEYIQDRDL